MRKPLQRLGAWMLSVVLVLAWIPASANAATSSPPPVRYPIIFVPGIGGTQLYNGNELVWVNTLKLVERQIPILNLFQLDWLLPLRLKADGTTPYLSRYHIHTGDIMRTGLTDIYSGMLASLKERGYVEGKDLRVFPFDWRLDPTEAAGALGRLVDRTLAETGAPQVVLMGHSMGGLIAREYVVRGGAPKVKAMIALATPWLGAPLAYRALADGWDMGLKIPGTDWSVLASGDIRALAQNYPAVYDMAPNRHFFDWYPDGYITRGGHHLTFAESLSQGLAPHNQGLAAQSPAYQDRLLDGRDHGVMQFLFAGKGKETSAGYDEAKDSLGFTQMTERYVDGDEVVPLYSADLGFSKDPARARQYIGRVVSVAYINRSHTFFTESAEVQRVVGLWLDIIQGRRKAGK